MLFDITTSDTILTRIGEYWLFLEYGNTELIGNVRDSKAT